MTPADLLKAKRIAGAGKKVTSGLSAAKEAEVMANMSRAGEMPLTAADRAMVGRMAAEATKNQTPTRMSEALGNVGAEGKKKVRVTQTDRTAAKYLGGAPFSMMQEVDPRYAEAMATWGVKTPGAAKNIANQAGEDILFSTLIGSPTQHRSNELIFDKLYNAFKKSVKEGNLNEELRYKFNKALEPMFGEGADILDPKLRKEIDTFEKRAMVGNLLLGEGLGGGLRGGSIIPGGKIMAETTEPMLRDVDTFSIGPRLFTLNKGIVTRPDLHPAFPEILQGEDLKQLFVPVPNEIALPDFNADFKARTGRKKPGYYDLTMTPPGQPYPTQDITEEYLTHLQKEGYAKGGLAHMAAGGTPSQQFPLQKTAPAPRKPISALIPLTEAAANVQKAYNEEKGTYGEKGAGMDILNRGFVSDVLGGAVDLANLPLQGLDYLQSQIPFLSKPASVMDVEGERTPIFPVSTDEPFAGKEAWNKQFQKAGITSKTERPIAEMATSLLAPFAPAAAGKAAKLAVKGAKAAAPTAGRLAQEFAEQTQFGMPLQMHVVKPKGGNWLAGAPENLTKGFKNRVPNPVNDAGMLELEQIDPEMYARLVEQQAPNKALDKWIDQKLNKYIKNEMGTPEDTIRLGIERRAAEAESLKELNNARLAKMEVDIAKAKAAGKDTTLSENDLAAAREKFDDEYTIASRGLYHGTVPEAGWNMGSIWEPEALGYARKRAGFPEEGMATHPASKTWEMASDQEIRPVNLSEVVTPPDKKWGTVETDTLKENPWIEKVIKENPKAIAYELDSIYPDVNLEFRHMIDEVREAMSPDTVLPKNLRIAPKDLEKMTVDDVSALAGKISAWRDIQKTKADLQLANNPAVHMFKEYPAENNPKGVAWKQIKRPEGLSDKEAEKFVREATKYEGDIMRHCVGGAGHCEPLLNGEVEIYTLRDAKGEPHVTIEVEPPTIDDHYEANRSTPYKEAQPRILEIKGKNNQKPKDEYIPFVQDFIKSGNFKTVGDSANADMYQPNPKTLAVFKPDRPEIADLSFGERFDIFEKAKKAGELNSYLTRDDWENILLKYATGKGFAKGGAVSSLEDRMNKMLADHHYAKGGAVSSNLEDRMNAMLAAHHAPQRMAEGGSPYNTNPDMADGGAFIQAGQFKIGGRIALIKH